MKTDVKPVLVLISDIHYNLQTLELADAALNQAIAKANDLDIPLVIAGDLHDTKANLRGECVNAMLRTMGICQHRPYIIVGNHDRINEKSPDHALNFLRPYAHIIDSPTRLPGSNIIGIPYYHDSEEFTADLAKIPLDHVVIMHQGVIGSNSGEYYVDKSAIQASTFQGRRVISGHYHTRQDIICPNSGLVSYIGNSYTLNFGEARDPAKGYQLLNSDGSLTFIPTNLRKHIVFEINAVDSPDLQANLEDLVLVKIAGTRQEVSKFKSSYPKNWKLEFIVIKEIIEIKKQNLSITKTIEELKIEKEQKIRILQLCEKYEV